MPESAGIPGETSSAPPAAPFPTPVDRLSGALAELAAATGLRFRLSLREAGAERTLHDSLGLGAGESDRRETWTLDDGSEAVATFAAPSDPGARSLGDLLRTLTPTLVRMERDIRFYNRELAARYGEVELLTSAAETLGAGVALERGIRRLLVDMAEVLRADAAEVWIVEDDEDRLVRFASSAPGASRAGIDLGLNRGPLAETIRRVEPQASSNESGAELLVPLRRSVVHGLRGALGLVRILRPRGRVFSPADRKLVAGLAGQVGAAFENRRLSNESLERERMLVELELAHHLQLKLLPELEDFVDCADIAARCEPAESVGGDFYHLFRLGGGRVGVMLGDVSSHGYSAGLIMALTMSAASLVVRERDRPAAVLRGIHQELVRKLESTDMYMTLCYAVLDPKGPLLRYANAGHPHAFRIGPETAERLEALNPPLGLAEFAQYEERELAWAPGRDTLLMFTDGLSETMRADRLWSDELILDAVRGGAGGSSGQIIERLFRLASPPGALPADDRTALVLK